MILMSGNIIINSGIVGYSKAIHGDKTWKKDAKNEIENDHFFLAFTWFYVILRHLFRSHSNWCM